MAEKERFIQVGFTAMRDPKTGDYHTAVPLYVKATEGTEEAEQALINDLGRLFADRIRRYRERCEAEGVTV